MARLPLVLASLFAIAALACGGDGDKAGNPFTGSSPPPATPPPAEPASTATPAPGDPPPTGVPASPTPDAPASGLPEVSVERVFAGIGFERMTGAYQDPDGNWYVLEQPGRVTRIPAEGGQAAVILDITDRVIMDGSEEGLLGFALSPDFASDNSFYLYYSAGGPRRSVIARYSLVPGGAVVSPEEVLLEVAQPATNHNAGQVVFGPDGYLYIALGDGGGGGDPQNHAQDLSTLLGSILRIDVPGGGAGYEVPRDNPFVGQPGARGEIWAYGFRNPWRFSFDRATGELWAGDVGAGSREEIDLVVAGGNYGWRVMEGSVCTGGGSGCNSGDYRLPVFEYETRSGGTCSVTGGFVYRGSAIPGLRGAYVFSDYCSGVIYALRATNGALTEQSVIGETGFRVSSFAEDNEGELYVLEHGGAGGIYKLVP